MSTVFPCNNRVQFPSAGVNAFHFSCEKAKSVNEMNEIYRNHGVDLPVVPVMKKNEVWDVLSREKGLIYITSPFYGKSDSPLRWEVLRNSSTAMFTGWGLDHPAGLRVHASQETQRFWRNQCYPFCLALPNHPTVVSFHQLPPGQRPVSAASMHWDRLPKRTARPNTTGPIQEVPRSLISYRLK